MENHGSNEKLVGLEAGLEWSEKPTNPNFNPIPIRERGISSNLVKLLFFSLSIVLLLVVGYEVHQVISNELLTEDLSNRDGLDPSKRALLTSSENSSRLQDMDMIRINQEQLLKLQERIDELSESIKFGSTAIPATTTIVPTTASQSEIDLTDELMLKIYGVYELETRIEELDDLFRESEAKIDWAKAARIYADIWAAIGFFERNIHSELQKSGFPINDYLENSQVQISTASTTEMLEAVSTIAPTEETISSWSWHFSFGNWGFASSDAETTEGPSETESNLSETETSSEESTSFMSRINIFPFFMSWGWNSEDEDENVTLDSVAQEVTTTKSEETSTVEPREQSAEISEHVNSPTTAEDYDYDSEDYYYYIFDNIHQSEAEEATGKPPLLEPEIGSVTSSSSTEELKDEVEHPTTATPPVSSSELPLPILKEGVDSKPEKIISDKSGPTAPQFYKLILKDGELHFENTLDDTTSESLGQIVKIERTGGFALPNIEDEDYSSDSEYDNWLPSDTILADVHDYLDLKDFPPPLIPRFSNYPAGIRSKRFVNNVQPAEVSLDDEVLMEQAAGKMAVLQQAIDVENHVIRNEISLTDKQQKLALQAKLNNFYKKMETVSAHIDRLHKKFLRLNSLNDDYVSREFPSDGGSNEK